MINMGHGPRICCMRRNGSLSWVLILFEWGGRTRPLTREGLLVDRVVALGLRVKGSLRNGRQAFLLRLLEILAVRSSFGLANPRIVVGFQNVFDEFNDRIGNVPLSSTAACAWEQANQATPVCHFCIPLSP